MGERLRAERLFLAVDLPEDVRRALERVQTRYPDLRRELRWVRGEGLHITLQFLGDVGAEQKAELLAELARLPPVEPFTLECSGVDTFGRVDRARVLWAGIRGDVGLLARLHAQVERATLAAGFAPEDREFRPHVTLARVREPARSPGLAGALTSLLAAYRGHSFGAVEVDGFTLYSSELTPRGALYTAVYRHPARG
ncbi:MAG: RNA 2',3'-cyclic phosphodiesterase [Chloroflexota bacterium]|nr:RNA 2',3'-cyclic phosphodiesterase [Chloroflexota bacterium]